jgi:hypothetical protein
MGAMKKMSDTKRAGIEGGVILTLELEWVVGHRETLFLYTPG